jgi:hypothetical protein
MVNHQSSVRCGRARRSAWRTSTRRIQLGFAKCNVSRAGMSLESQSRHGTGHLRVGGAGGTAPAERVASAAAAPVSTSPRQRSAFDPTLSRRARTARCVSTTGFAFQPSLGALTVEETARWTRRSQDLAKFCTSLTRILV